jgi:hypothetical protein
MLDVPGTTSTWGNPIAIWHSWNGNKIMINLAQNAVLFGWKTLHQQISVWTVTYGFVEKGSLNAIRSTVMRELDLAWRIVWNFRDYGLLAKPTHGNKMTKPQ